MEIWCFLQAFQRSPWKFFYFKNFVEALLSLSNKNLNLRSFRQSLIEECPELENHPLWQQLHEDAQKIQAEEERALSNEKIEFVYLGHAQYPKALAQISDPPLALAVEGDLSSFMLGEGVAVVGSREPHDMTQRWMKEEFYAYLRDHPQPVVSGGARGVDQLAHQIALFINCPTCVVIPSGLCRKYPKIWNEDRNWREKGLVFVSETPLSKSISKHHFASRNRIIAGLVFRVLIAEAKLKSGTIMTAHHALTEGRFLGVVPGHPLIPQFAGSLELIDHGGEIITNSSDIAKKFGSRDLRNFYD